MQNIVIACILKPCYAFRHVASGCQILAASVVGLLQVWADTENRLHGLFSKHVKPHAVYQHTGHPASLEGIGAHALLSSVLTSWTALLMRPNSHSMLRLAGRCAKASAMRDRARHALSTTLASCTIHQGTSQHEDRMQNDTLLCSASTSPA